MLADPEGREILRARPVINEATVDLAALAVSVSNAISLVVYAEHPRVSKVGRDTYVHRERATQCQATAC